MGTGLKRQCDIGKIHLTALFETQVALSQFWYLCYMDWILIYNQLLMILFLILAGFYISARIQILLEKYWKHATICKVNFMQEVSTVVEIRKNTT